jgi:hypothetical protein
LSRTTPPVPANALDRPALTVAYELVEAATEYGLGFAHAEFCKCGATTCPACGAAVDDKCFKAQGRGKRMGITPLAAVLVTSVPPRRRWAVASVAERDRPQNAESGSGRFRCGAGVIEPGWR